ncbi:MAG: aldehyde dehydrogenase family protein [Ignavibacteriales bacterium]|nr:aldehyde dehydrogenase family protein [Ignavibacteriales bacterium]
MIEEIFNKQNQLKNKLRLSSSKERIAKLNNILNWILNNRANIKTALQKDFRKSGEETDITEIYPLVSEIRNVKKNLRKWMKPNFVKRSIIYLTHSAFVKYESKGVVLIISTWNYPFLLSIGPLISAIAAGNPAIIKPSEISPNTSELISKMILELFPNKEIAVVQGDKAVSTELLKLPFDHIFFTGSTEIGKIVAKAASENLSDYTLELGGKSPVIVEKSASLKSTAEKIVWGKYLNKGQTCVAPDYILIDKDIRNSFTELLVNNIKKYYGNNHQEVETNLNYARIINEKHHSRLVEIIENTKQNDGQILYGGKYDSENYFIEPTIILTNCEGCKISEEEIFGPILPIVEYTNLDEAIQWINKRNPPLSIYIFSNNKIGIDKVINSTHSGGIGLNELVIHFSHPHLPFGGVRHSGIGRSHGFAGFKEFSYERSFIKAGKLNFLKIIYPPYNNRKRKIVDFFVKYL